MPASRRNCRLWPFTTIGTIVFLGAAVIVGYVGYMAFWYIANTPEEAALMLRTLK
jgi:hypothetical protein